MGKKGPTSHAVKVQQLKDFLIDISLVHALTNKFNEIHPEHLERRHSARLIHEKYGSGCAELFRLIYTCWLRGGKILNGKSFKSAWVMIPEHKEAFVQLIKERTDDCTAKDWVRKLRARGITETYRGRLWDEAGNLQMSEILTKEENKELILLKKEKRAAFSETKKKREAEYF